MGDAAVLGGGVEPGTGDAETPSDLGRSKQLADGDAVGRLEVTQRTFHAAGQ
jgi:hypothetical protein